MVIRVISGHRCLFRNKDNKQVLKMVIDLRNTKLSDQIKKVNEIIESSFKETSIITNEETIIKMIPMQILDKKIKCKMKFTDNSWRVNLIAKEAK
ncbi:MAG: hypothetical protein VXX35_03355 [Chloroflexota bacterium]|nr:hypothetical protein [Chloroflexota bacterium]